MFLAYIDPGSGSVLIQVILASMIGGIAIFWNRIKLLFMRKKPAEAAAVVEEAAEATSTDEAPPAE